MRTGCTGRWQTRGERERRLFPGGVAFLLAVVAVLLRRPSRLIIVYVLAGVAAFEASLGFRGYLVLVSVRARPGVRWFAGTGASRHFRGVLSSGSFGVRLHLPGCSLRRRSRLILLLVLLAAVLLEDFTTVPLVTYPNTAPPVYRLLASQPPGVVAEFPMPRLDTLPGQDPKYGYLSIFHWRPLVNGYSGFYPPTYYAADPESAPFSGSDSLRVLRREGVRYLMVHESGYEDRTRYERNAVDTRRGRRSAESRRLQRRRRRRGAV